MKMIKKILIVILFVIALCLLLSPFVHWVMNDHLTQMQVFKKTWYLSISGVIILQTAFFTLDKLR